MILCTSVSLRMNTIASRDKFKPIRLGEHLVGELSRIDIESD